MRWVPRWACWTLVATLLAGSTARSDDAAPTDPSAAAPPPFSASTPSTGQPSSASRYQRRPHSSEWEVLFEDGISAKEYARQIDFFHIELAAEDAKGKLHYAAKLSQPKPESRAGEKTDEPRISIGWKKGTLVSVDRKLLSRAGIISQGKKLYHFYPLEVESKLFDLEADYFRGDDPDEIVRTRFKIRAQPAGDAYEFYVDEQELKSGVTRPAASSSSRRSAGQ